MPEVERRAYLENVAAQEAAYWYCREHKIRADDLDIGQILQVAGPIIMGEARDLLLELIESSGYVDTDERIRWIELQVDKELMQRLQDWQQRQVNPQPNEGR
jgi:hypothetical protein